MTRARTGPGAGATSGWIRNRVQCSGWTLPRETVAAVRQLALARGVSASRVVEDAIKLYFADVLEGEGT